MRLLILALMFFFAGKPSPFDIPARVRVLIFARTDCPITNRYTPEIARIAREFSSQDVKFWMVYEDAAETSANIEKHMADFRLPGVGIRDLHGELRKRAGATVSPQAAVFDSGGRLVYSGRIDDRFVAFGRSRPMPNAHDLEDAVRATLSGKAVAQLHTKAIGCYLSDVY